MRVLIAHRDVTILEALQSYLWDCGHEAEIAMDGIECSVILNEYVPDVVVVADDLLWGGYEGVMAKMSENPSLSAIPVIQVGNRVREANQGALWGPPVVGWLPQHFRIGQLINQLSSIRRKMPLLKHPMEVESWLETESSFT